MIVKDLHFKLGLLILLLAGLTNSSIAQSGSAAAFSRMGFGPRGMAMGNALTSVTNNGIYSYYNPALAAHSSSIQVDIGTTAMSFGRTLNTATGSFDLPPTGGIALSIINANVSDIDGRSSSGYHTEMLSTSEYQIATALAQRVGKKLSAGVGLKYYIADLHDELSSSQTLGVDIGVLYRFSDELHAGAVVRDLLASYNWNSSTLYGDNASGRTNNFPTQVQLGLSYQLIPDLLLSFNGGKTMHENQSLTNVKFGSAYHIHERLTLRGGWQIEDLSSIKTTNHFSTGFSLHLPFDLFSPSVDYAFVQEPNNISRMHSFGIQLQL